MSGMYGLVRRLIMVGTVVGLVPGAAWAQGTGIVAGTVTDQTGGVLPGTSVDIRPEGAQRVLETVTDSTGAYRFENLPPGPAELTFRLINFSTIRRVVTISAGGMVTADALMQVATSADIVITAPRTFRTWPRFKTPLKA